MYLVQLRLIDQAKLILKWNDGTESLIPLKKLRKFCPCAACMTEMDNQSDSYIPIFHASQIRISKVTRIGNYAVNIHWEDGHNTGIYEFSFLKNLSES